METDPHYPQNRKNQQSSDSPVIGGSLLCVFGPLLLASARLVKFIALFYLSYIKKVLLEIDDVYLNPTDFNPRSRTGSD